jgi:hypothetical protein
VLAVTEAGNERDSPDEYSPKAAALGVEQALELSEGAEMSSG